MANDTPRSILRMNECPMCGYDVSRLPARHQCPECGFAYDEQTYMLVVNLRGMNPYEFWVNCLVFVPFAIVGSMPFVGWRYAQVLVPVALLTIVISLVGIRTVRMRNRARNGGESKFWVRRDGFAFKGPIGDWKLQPWSKFEGVRLWQLVNGKPVPTVHDSQWLFLTAPVEDDSTAWWRIWLRPVSWTRITSAGVEFDIRCTPLEASQIVNDLRGRLNLSPH